MSTPEFQIEQQNEKNEKNEPHNTGIPFSVSKPSSLKMIGLVGLVAVIIGANIFFMEKDNVQEKQNTDSATETFSSKSVNPLTQDEDKSVNANTTANQNQALLKQKLEEAKAKDFIERLQAVQSIDANEPGTASNATAVNAGGESNPNVSMATPTDSNTAFLQNAGSAQPERSYAGKFSPQPYLIGQGKFIFGTLAVAINSDLPGQVSAVVNQDVYGEQGRHVLIPRGSRLVGEYRSGLANNQSRLFVVWTRVVQPNGISVMIGSEGTDALGQAGLTGNVDYHFFARFGTATLISMIGAGASTIGVSPNDQYNSAAAYRQAIAQSTSEQASSLLSQTANIPPTIHVAQGEKIVVFVNKDLDFSRVYR